MSLSKWARPAGVTILGALSALSLPPINFFPVLWLCLPLLLREIDRCADRRRAFLTGWLFGLGHFVAGLYWIAYALLVDAERFGWAVPFAVLGLGGILALYIGAVSASSRLVRAGWPRLLLFAAAWGAAEWLRGQLFTGFSWNPIASAWSRSIVMLQILSVVGSFGLGVITVAAAGAPALWWRSRRSGIVATALGLGCLAVIGLWGAWRLPAEPVPDQPGIRLRLVQANIEQTLKWRPEMRELNLNRQLALSQSPAEIPITHIVWPETAAPAFLDHDGQARQALADATPKGGLMLVGSVRGVIKDRQVAQIWNSLLAIDEHGAILGSYDKAHLVPFGEYMPLPSWLPLAKITVGDLGFSAGSGPRTLTLPGLPPVGPLICYEDIFPGAIIERADRPAWLLIVTNDGWFGMSSGPYQHFAAARMRAVEQGLPVVRAANTGISGVVDPYGRVVAQLALGQAGIADSFLPQPLGETIFSRWRGAELAILLIFTAGLALIGHFLPMRC